SLFPQLRSQRPLHAFRFAFSNAFCGGIKSYTKPFFTENMKHHINMLEGHSPALFCSTGFFCKNIKVETKSIMCENRISVLPALQQKVDHIRQILLAHSCGRPFSFS